MIKYNNFIFYSSFILAFSMQFFDTIKNFFVIFYLSSEATVFIVCLCFYCLSQIICDMKQLIGDKI